MFFGAGNLVFPLQIGQSAGEYWALGAFGLTITGIILPFLGLFVIKLYRGNYLSFFGGAGSFAKHFLPFFTLSLLGSFGGMPRCVAIAYGGINRVAPISLGCFSVIFCVATYCICLKKQRLIDVVGKWLTPILVLFLVVLISLCARHSGESAGVAEASAATALIGGLTTGYQTMDVLAAFFFSSMIFLQIKKTMPEESTDEDVLKVSIKAGALACALLAAVYSGMVFMGAKFAYLTKNVNPSEMFVAISESVLGNYAAFFIGATVMLACFTTVVALNDIYARYLHSLLKLKEDNFKFILLGTTATAFIMSLLDFRGITKFLVPVLDVLYPSVIALTLVSLFSQKPSALKKALFYATAAAMLLFS
jgi:LIVCS family branched-chain amino acid:cation transporter